MAKEIKKRFPANTTLSDVTFLNDKKVDGELYAYFQILSFPEDNQTIVSKKDLPTKKEMCGNLGFKSVKTFNSHLKYLIEKGYIIEELEKYILPNVEDFYTLIPLETLRVLNNTLQEQVIKVYIYLGQKHKYKEHYEFTIKELATHIGIKLDNHSRAYQLLNDILTVLSSLGLVKFITKRTGTEEIKILTHFDTYINEVKSASSYNNSER